jgi:predicted ribosomally synthesized peptide with nif11-like leader
MSTQAAREALERLKRDEAFRDRLGGMDDPAERLAALHDAGYDCSEEELAHEAGRLDDEDLNIGGGQIPLPCQTHCGWVYG